MDEKKSMELITQVMNDALNAMMKKHPDEDIITVMKKTVFESYDRLAIKLEWSEKEKQKALDSYFDIFNEMQENPPEITYINKPEDLQVEDELDKEILREDIEHTANGIHGDAHAASQEAKRKRRGKN